MKHSDPAYRGDRPALLISLDFELYWGVHDLYPVERCKDYLDRTRSAVTRILELFRQHEIHASWATVGFLFYPDRQQLLSGLPEVLPNYADARYSPYPGLTGIGADEREDPYRYGASLLQAVRDTPHQEIGTHTFSHFYCLEDGITADAFRSDLEAAVRAARQWNVDLRSLVFPRNQIHPAYLEILRELGIACYRDNQKHWIYRERKRTAESQFRRAARLLDAYVNLSGHHTYRAADVDRQQPVALPASRLLRSYSPALRMFEPLRLARICNGLRHAARRGHVFHLWLHPEEMALHQDHNLAALRRIVECFAELRSGSHMESLSMGELACRLTPGAASGVAAKARTSTFQLEPRAAVLAHKRDIAAVPITSI